VFSNPVVPGAITAAKTDPLNAISMMAPIVVVENLVNFFIVSSC
jgi:hypothetical protein